MITINVDEEFESQVSRPKLERAASVTLDACLEEDAVLTVVVTGNEKIRTLNKKHRGVDKPTDVLSFPADYMDPDLGLKYLGDVLISYPAARAQSEDEVHGVGEELQLLVVHGVLHLLGYDHLSGPEKEEMASLQTDIMVKLDLDLDIEGW